MQSENGTGGKVKFHGHVLLEGRKLRLPDLSRIAMYLPDRVEGILQNSMVVLATRMTLNPMSSK